MNKNMNTTQTRKLSYHKNLVDQLTDAHGDDSYRYGQMSYEFLSSFTDKSATDVADIVRVMDATNLERMLVSASDLSTAVAFAIASVLEAKVARESLMMTDTELLFKAMDILDEKLLASW